MSEIIYRASLPGDAVSFIERISWQEFVPVDATITIQPSICDPDEDFYPLVMTAFIGRMETALKISGISAGDSTDGSLATLRILTYLGFNVESDDILTTKKFGTSGQIILTYAY